MYNNEDYRYHSSNPNGKLYADPQGYNRTSNEERGDYSAPAEQAAMGDDFEKLLYYNTEKKEQRIPAPRTVVSEEADYMPSVTTMQFKEANIYEDYREKNESVENRQYKINTKGKVLIAVYALVLLTIFTLIILNTRLLKNVNTEITQSQNTVAALRIEYNQLSDELTVAQSDEAVEVRAVENGMIKE